jgi:hypothetical protein
MTRCRRHGGASTGRPIVTGRYSVTHRQALAAKVQRFLEDPAPADLSAELALIRALLQDYLERYSDGVALPADEIERIMGMVETISRLVERIARILNATALTAAEVQLLTARLGDLVTKYVEPEKRLAFLDELDALVGSDSRSSRARLAGDAFN